MFSKSSRSKYCAIVICKYLVHQFEMKVDIQNKLKTDTFLVKEWIRLSDFIACRRHRFNFFASSKLSGERLDGNWDENYVTLCKRMSYKSRFVAFGAIEKISEVINPRRSFLCYIGNDPIDKDAVTFYASQ